MNEEEIVNTLNTGDITTIVIATLAALLTIGLVKGVGLLKEFVINLVNRTGTDLDNELLAAIVDELYEKEFLSENEAKKIKVRIAKKDQTDAE